MITYILSNILFIFGAIILIFTIAVTAVRGEWIDKTVAWCNRHTRPMFWFWMGIALMYLGYWLNK